MSNLPMIVRCGWHHTFGWLRRREMDNRDGYCYEAPDGDLIYTSTFNHEKAMVLYEMVDPETGDHYLVDRVGSDY
jgi:hypothetical protein